MTTIGVMGLGSIGLRHARNLLSLGVRVVGFDPAPERRALLVEDGGDTVEAADALSFLPALVVCTPSGRHRQDLLDALAAGQHVFIEKPLAHCAEGLEAPLKAAAAKGQVVFVGFNLRFHGVVNAARNWLDDGVVGVPLWARVIGSSFLPAWRPHIDYRQGYAADPATGGAIFDWIHEIDLACHLLGAAELAAAAAANTGSLQIAAEDVGVVVLRHPGNVLSSIHLDFCTRPGQRSLQVAGTKGVLDADLLARTLVLRDGDGAVLHRENCDGSWDADYRNEIGCFLDCIAGRAQPPVDGLAGLAVLRLAVAARQAARLPSR